MGKLSTERQAAKDAQEFFIDCTIDGRYLPDDWDYWRIQTQTRGPIARERVEDVLALQLWLIAAGKKSLHECLRKAEAQLAQNNRFLQPKKEKP